MNNTNVDSIVPVKRILRETDRNILNVNYNIHTTTPGINANPGLMEGDFISDFANYMLHSTRNTRGNQLYYLITPDWKPERRLCQNMTTLNAMTVVMTLQHLHMSELLHHDEDAVDPDGSNDIDVSRMITGGGNNHDFTIRGFPSLQLSILHEFNDIFSYNVIGKAMAVPQ